MRQLIVFAMLLSLSSCLSEGKKEETSARIDTYFDLEGFLSGQVLALTSDNARLTKTLGVGEEQERIESVPDAEGWKKELELFYAADINKPGLVDAYDSEELSLGGGNRRLIYQAKSSKLNVRNIDLKFQNERLQSLGVSVVDNNSIYQFNKEMEMHFKEENGRLLIDYYLIKGSQTMVMKKDLDFQVRGEITF